MRVPKTFQTLFLCGLIAGTARHAAAQIPGAEATALTEMQQLALAEEACAIQTGYYVSLETLNDVTAQSQDSPWDWLYREGGTWVILPSTGRFNDLRFVFPTDPLKPRGWSGPYLNYQPGRVQTALSPYDQGSPLDPWGQPYLFFTPLGLVRGDTRAITLEAGGDRFDRYAIVSLGFNGQYDPTGGDDLIYRFGGGVSAAVLSRVAGTDVIPFPGGPGGTQLAENALQDPSFSVPAGATIALHGYNLNPVQEDRQIFFGNRDLTGGILAWSDNVTTLTLPADLEGMDTIYLARGTARTNGLTLQVRRNGAADWTGYR